MVTFFFHFFYPEIKKSFGDEKVKDIEQELISKDSQILDCFEEKRIEGENDTFICSLIRNDSIEKFVEYVTQTNYLLDSEVKSSIFETNTFLIENKNTTLIEYSAFFGSIQIFQYLRMNNVKLKPSLWLYAIHSRNAELIHLLISYHINPPNDNFETCLCESIKCHHNEIAEYIENNLITEDSEKTRKKEEVISSILQFHNYYYFPSYFEDENEFFYLYSNHYNELSDLYMKMKKEYIEKVASNITLQEAADGNKIEIIYYLLLSQEHIYKDCFYKNKNLRRIAIPSSISSIDSYAFQGCSSLREIIIPSSVKSIEKHAFSNCISLKEITIPSHVTSINDYAFKGCSSLERIVIPSSVTRIGQNVFIGCSSLTYVTIPLTSSFDNDAFYGIKSLIITGNISKIKNKLFYSNSSLREIIIASSVTSIGGYSFAECFSLSRIMIPYSVTSIGWNAFKACNSLEEINIPSSVTSIADFAFCQCYSLKRIKIPSSVTWIGWIAFKECSSLKEITIPSSIASIGNYTFYKCESLKRVEIPSSVTSNGNSAFEGCSSLVQITIPSSVASIGKDAFEGCSRLPEDLLSQITDLQIKKDKLF